MNSATPANIAVTILAGFDKHFSVFQGVTADAMTRFEQCDWKGAYRASRERIDYYDMRVEETIAVLKQRFSITELDESLWAVVKLTYVGLLHRHRQPELAESYYNSVFCRLFERRYFHNENIFVRPAISTEHLESDAPAYRSYYPTRDGFEAIFRQVLSDAGFGIPFENAQRDVANLVGAFSEHFPPGLFYHQNFQLAVLRAPFFRNKGAYIIGKVVNGVEHIPFVMPVLNNEQCGLYVDTLLVGPRETEDVFSIARAYFMVDTDVPSEVVDFLAKLLPCKTKADLYAAIGLQKHGKTEFYRDFLHHLRHSSDEFVIAPGIKGMVMSVFTLPSYPYVFKIINDHFPAPKEVDRETVMAKYQLVKQHDRVGRMADSLEYSHAAFPLERFSPELLAELQQKAPSSLKFEDGQLVIKHIYIERRMQPLNLYIDSATDAQLRHVIDGYGQAIKDLATAGIFPGDLLFKNFGVTRQGRVVFYDYDEICYLGECNFRHIPEPRTPEDEFAAEPWYSVGADDVFPEEFASVLLTNPRIGSVFRAMHAELLDAEYWKSKQRNAASGEVEDVFPYSASLRFRDRAARQEPEQQPDEPLGAELAA